MTGGILHDTLPYVTHPMLPVRHAIPTVGTLVLTLGSSCTDRALGDDSGGGRGDGGFDPVTAEDVAEHLCDYMQRCMPDWDLRNSMAECVSYYTRQFDAYYEEYQRVYGPECASAVFGYMSCYFEAYADSCAEIDESSIPCEAEEQAIAKHCPYEE